MLVLEIRYAEMTRWELMETVNETTSTDKRTIEAGTIHTLTINETFRPELTDINKIILHYSYVTYSLH